MVVSNERLEPLHEELTESTGNLQPGEGKCEYSRITLQFLILINWDA